MSPSEVPDTITCVECGGTANRMSYPPPDEGFLPGDVIVYACEDCRLSRCSRTAASERWC